MCPDCTADKPQIDFGRLSPRCRSCANVRKRSKNRLAVAEWKARNPGKRAAIDSSPSKRKYNEEYRIKNRDACRKRSTLWFSENRERRLQKSRDWYAANKETKKLTDRRWQANNPHKASAKEARHRAALIRACPSWADHDKIDAIYAAARRISRETGIPHHVDHIYPLQSDLMCGLHVENNLQILPATENVSKSNRSWPGSADLKSEGTSKWAL